jgi:arsenite methyltransferase
MSTSNVYESKYMSCVLGDTLRPGGFELTDKGVDFCKFEKGSRILDVGCGSGNTVEYLKERYSFDSYGIDPSKMLLEEGKVRNPELNIFEGTGEKIPFDDDYMDGIFAECTLSLMEDLPAALNETHRVLKNNGYFVITDVYAKNPEYLELLNKFSFNSCLRGLHDIEKLKSALESIGFEVMLFEDYTHLLRELMVKIIFKYGSMNVFWSKATSCSTNCSEFQKVLSECKVGYFLLIAKRGIN